MKEKEFDSITDVMIEATRKCNMNCDHCLRGKQENIEQTKENIDILFSKVSYISCLMFTGGEPSLNPSIIEYCIESAKRNNVDIANFWLATNGKEIKEDFIVACLRLYAYCTDRETTGVMLSVDRFHDVYQKDYELLQGLSFFSERPSPKDDSNLINQGNAKENELGEREPHFDNYEIDGKDILEGLIYMNCKGDILNCCDLSFEEQEFNVICKVSELSIEKLEPYSNHY